MNIDKFVKVAIKLMPYFLYCDLTLCCMLAFRGIVTNRRGMFVFSIDMFILNILILLCYKKILEFMKEER